MQTNLTYTHLSLIAAVPIILVIIPLIVDMATGHAMKDDIIVRRGADISL